VAEENHVAGSALSEVIQCAGSDRWLAVEAETAADLQTLQQVVGLDTSPLTAIRVASATEIADALRRWATVYSPHQAARKLQRAGIAAAPVQNNEDVILDRQHRARGYFEEVAHPDLGVMELPRSLYPSASPVHGSRAPRLGEHNDEILEEWLGVPPGRRQG
jgi:crotonobetainyl-CoA:carnitine CoA-transferase CaiB-like acyl-CoA transferase